MQTFKAFYKTTLKHITSLIIYLGIFFILLILMTTINKDENSTYTAQKVSIAVFDYDNSVLSRGLTQYLADTQTIVELEDNDETLIDELYYRNVTYVLRIKNGFSEDFNNLENMKIPDSIYTNLIDSETDRYLSFLSAYSEYEDSEAVRLTKAALDKEVKTNYINLSANGSNSFIYNFYLYLPYIFTAIMVCALGGILLVFRNEDLNKRIQCGAVSLIKRNILLTICSILFSFFVWLILIIICLLMLQKDFFTFHNALFIVNSLVTMLTAVAITYLVSFFVKSSNTLTLWSNIIGLGFGFISGIFIPQEVLGSSVLVIARFLPTYWYVKTCNYIEAFTCGASLKPYFSYIGIQLLFCIALLVVALATSKIKKNN